MRNFILACIAFVAFGFITVAEAGVTVHINKSSQTMTVSVNGVHKYTWAVSTGKKGYGTPTGSFTKFRLERTWFSSTYDGAPMPHSIFFKGGYAIHGTTEVGRLGRPASHGCVRLHPGNAAALFALVKGNRGSTVVIVKN